MIELIFLFQDTVEHPILNNPMSIMMIVIVALFIGRGLFYFIEGFYVDYIAKKPLFRHLYLFPRNINESQKRILERDFDFYKQLDVKQQKYFRYRVAKFISSVEFIGKEGLVIDDEKEVLIAATAIMLTFGYRNYHINLVDKVLIYPSTFYSTLDENFHKGHFNPGYRAILMSWEDFLHGYEIGDDNLNLGIHEFVHALHLSYLSSRGDNGLSSHLFMSSLDELKEYIDAKVHYKEKMKNSDYFRSYAFENDFEFIAVIIETFIETPNEFRSKFPEIYKYVKQMLNFEFKGY